MGVTEVAIAIVETEIVVVEMIIMGAETIEKSARMEEKSAIGMEIVKEAEAVTAATVVEIVEKTNVIVGGEVIVAQTAMTVIGITENEETEAEDEVIDS